MIVEIIQPKTLTKEEKEERLLIIRNAFVSVGKSLYERDHKKFTKEE